MLNSKRKIRLRKRREYWFRRSIEVAKKEAERIDLTMLIRLTHTNAEVY